MLYLIYGSDTAKSRNKYHELIDSLRARQPEAAMFLLDGENFSVPQWQELLVGQGLFNQKYIVGGNRLLADKNHSEAVAESIEAMALSANIFILIEESVKAEPFRQLEKFANKIQFFDRGEKEEKEYGDFAAADALARRDKKKLWVEYQRLLGEGSEPEMIFWQLWWQLRMLLIAKTTKQKAPKTIKPFVFNKAARGAANYTEEELKSLSAKLVNFYHRHFAGSDDFALGLERLILEI